MLMLMVNVMLGMVLPVNVTVEIKLSKSDVERAGSDEMLAE